MDFDSLNKAGLNYLLKDRNKEFSFLAWDIAIALNTLKIISQKNLEPLEIEQLEKCIEIFTHLYIDFLNENGENVFGN